MSISKQLEKTNMAECRLGKDSDVLQTAINDSCSGIDSEKCSAETFCRPINIPVFLAHFVSQEIQSSI